MILIALLMIAILKKGMIFIALLMIAIFVAGCTGKPLEQTVETVPVHVKQVEVGSICKVYYSIGQLLAKEDFEISTGQPGTIEAIHVAIGDVVKKDQTLFQMDNFKLSNQIQSQESQLKSQLDLSLIQLNDAKKLYDQKLALYDEKAVSKDALDQAKDHLEQAEINYQNASNTLSLNMKALKDDLKHTYIKSPINGVVAAIYIQEGEDVGAITAMKVVNPDLMKAKIQVPAKIIGSLKIGQKAKVWLDGDKNSFVMGEVTKIDLATQGNMNLYPVEITVANAGELLSGMYVETEIHLNEKTDAVIIDKAAVIMEGEKDFVFLVNEGTSKKTIIKKGIESGDKVEVLTGIKADETVVVRGHDYLEGGELLQIVELNDDSFTLTYHRE